MYARLIQPRTFMPLVILLLITLFISACSNQPVVKKEKTPTNTIQEKEQVGRSAQQTLALAQQLAKEKTNEPNAQVTQLAKINELLIEASELFVQEENYTKALWLANETSLTHQAILQNNYRLLLVKAESLQALNFNQHASNQLKLARELVEYALNYNEAAPKLTLKYYDISAQLFTTLNKPVDALNAKLHAFALNELATSDDVQALWQQFESLTPWQISQLLSSNPPYIQGWSKLLYYCQKYGENNNQLARYLKTWQRSYPSHPASIIIEPLLADNLFNTTADVTLQNVAVLLPLSGAQKNAGLAAQQGILAAYQNNSNINIHFIDTNTLNWDELASTFSTHNIDHIVGPLLKSNVEQFLALSPNTIEFQVPTVLLNLSSKYALADYQSALSMRPEDEAEQAAQTLSQQQYQKPIILSHNDNVSKRIALAFSKQWQISSGSSVDIVYFEEGKQMQVSLKESLDVNASQSRIKHLNDRLQNTIKSEARNRRDIDMIYLVGSAAQTRLIKPYIDVNISPFADIIPVYASSRSHSNFHDKYGNSSTNDLAGLTFTQIPWLLDSPQQNKALTQLSDQLWPKRTDSLSRIFAMGYDSYQLLNKLSSMKKSPYIRHFGQTGVLKLNENNLITRSLLWGQYKNDKVMQVVMD